MRTWHSCVFSHVQPVVFYSFRCCQRLYFYFWHGVMREGVLRDPRLGTPLGSIELFADAYDVSDKVKQLASSAHDEKGPTATAEAMHGKKCKENQRYISS